MEKLYIVSDYVLEEYVPEHIAELIRTSNDQSIGWRTGIDQLDYPKYKKITMDDQCRALGMKTFDIALPQSFVDLCIELTSQSPVGHLVMCYDENKNFGELKPVDKDGVLLLKIYNHIQKGDKK